MPKHITHSPGQKPIKAPIAIGASRGTILSKPIIPMRLKDNAEDDFYSVHGACIQCGAPQSVAPDLIDHSETETGHCFFRKQPQTNDEIDRAINAVVVSCISGIRYGGKDEKILNRLYELGYANECDHKYRPD